MSRWPERDLFAITSEGVVLINAAALDDVDLVKLVRSKNVFVGVPLRRSERRLVLRRLHEAMSEAAAYVSGERRRRAHR